MLKANVLVSTRMAFVMICCVAGRIKDPKAGLETWRNKLKEAALLCCTNSDGKMQGNRTYKLGTRKLTWKWKPKRLKTKKLTNYTYTGTQGKKHSRVRVQHDTGH